MYKVHQSRLFNKLIAAAPIVAVINNDGTGTTAILLSLKK
jgi:hypothetical protein